MKWYDSSMLSNDSSMLVSEKHTRAPYVTQDGNYKWIPDFTVGLLQMKEEEFCVSIYLNVFLKPGR